MKRSELEPEHFKTQAIHDFEPHKKQKNYCIKLYKKERNRYYNKSNLTNHNDNRRLWKTVKPFSSKKRLLYYF